MISSLDPVVALVVSDKKLRERLMYLLKNTFGKEVTVDVRLKRGKKYALIITDRELDHIRKTVKAIKVARELNVSDFMERVRVLVNLPENPAKLVVGIDPGVRIGAAVLCSNVLITWKVFKVVSNVVVWIKRIMEITGIEEIEVKIGVGWRFREIFERVSESGIKHIRLISEENTTRKGLEFKSREKLDREVLSAIRIALKL